MTTFVGTGALVRFALRRDRIRISVWLVSVALLVLVTAASTVSLYPTQESLDDIAALSRDNPAAVAFNGPPIALDTLGGQVTFQLSSFGLVVVGLMSVLMVVRLTRSEEESGRLELVGSMAVGRHAPLASAAVVVGAMSVASGVATTLALLAQGLEAPGSIALGTSFTVLGLIFVGIGGVTAQLTENPRVASGLAGGVLGLSFVIRALGDVGDGTASWFSPIGLVQKARPFGGESWWPLLLGLLLAGACVAVAAWLATHRDFGAGLVVPRPGPPSADRSFDRPLGLAVRLQRPAVLWWALGLLIVGATYGSIADSIEGFVADNQAMADLLASAGGASIVDSYLSTSLLILALVATCAAVQCSLRPRSEEVAGHTEALLATPTSRSQWLLGHVVVSFVGSALVMVAGAFGLGAAYGIVIGDLGQAPRLVLASLVHLPAIWLVAATAIALFGLVRAAQVVWAGVALAFVLAMLGAVLDLPQWVLDLSPFQHVPQAPATTVSAVPIATLGVLVAIATGVGFLGFARRDLG